MSHITRAKSRNGKTANNMLVIITYKIKDC